MILFESNLLTPSPGFIVAVVLYAALLVIWPAVEASGRGQLVWVVLIVLLSPLAGIAWFAVGRWVRDPRRPEEVRPI